MADQKIHRALIALDAAGIPRVLATDSATIAYEFDDLGTDAGDIGLLNAKDIGPGLWLWEGKVTATGKRMDYEGKVIRVFGMHYLDPRLPGLFEMAPPDSEFEEEDRESPET